MNWTRGDIDTMGRREAILKRLSQEQQAISASQLAKEFHVSRQVVVGDIALLRAQGEAIVSTSKGYLLSSNVHNPVLTNRIVCKHRSEETLDELFTIVDFGGAVLDVRIDHPIYKEIVVELKVRSRKDAMDFMANIENKQATLLSGLTDGVHIHTIETATKEEFDQIKEALNQKGYLYTEMTK